MTADQRDTQIPVHRNTQDAGGEANLEERIIELETRLTYQDDALQQLDAVVIAQRAELDRLQRELDVLKQQIWDLGHASGDAPEPPPPHY